MASKRDAAVPNAAPNRNAINDDRPSAHRFTSVLTPIHKPSPTPPQFQNAIAIVRPVSELPPLNRFKSFLSDSSVATPSVSANATSVTGNVPIKTDKKTTPTTTAPPGRREGWRAAHGIHDDVQASVPELAALPVPISARPPGPSTILPLLSVTVNKSSAMGESEVEGTARRTVLRVKSPLQETPPAAAAPAPTPASAPATATATAPAASSPAQERSSSLPNRRITFVIDSPATANEMMSAPPALAPPLVRQRNILAPREDLPLHSEVGMYQLEYLDEGGRLQRRLTAYYHCCADQAGLDEEDAEALYADRLGPYLRESRQFRVYVADDIDRACGMVNTAVTLCAKEEQEPCPVGSAASDNGTDTVTLTGTVVNALKETEAPTTSEMHESYQPLQGAIFESALRKAWEWKQKTRAEAAPAAEATTGGVCPSATPSPGRSAEKPPQLLTSTVLTEPSPSASAAASGRATPTRANPTTTTSTENSKSAVEAGVANTTAFSSTSLPTFKAEVKASLQLDSNNDPHSPLTALQLLVRELCGAEMVSRKVLWTAFLADRYDLSAAVLDLVAFSSAAESADLSVGGHNTLLRLNAAALQRYLNLTLEQYLPWMTDVYLATYKPVPASRSKTVRHNNVGEMSALGGAPSAASKSLSARRFRSVVHADQRPLPLVAPRGAAAGGSEMPLMPMGVKTAAAFAVSASSTSAVREAPAVFTVSFLFAFSFVILEELGVGARMHPTEVVEDAMHLLIPKAASLTRDSFFNSLTHSASVVVVSDSTTTGAQGHELLLSARSLGGGANTVAESGGGGGGSGSGGGGGDTTGPITSNGSCTADLTAATGRDSVSNAAPQSRLLRQYPQLSHLTESPPHHADGVLRVAEAPPDVVAVSATRAAAAASRKAARHYSSYESSRVWLKMLFRFFRNEEAHNFLNDSPISMRNFLPLPHVSWERVLLRSQTVLAWAEFHAAMTAAADSLWGFMDKARSTRWRNKRSGDARQWERALRHSEQQALNLAAATHELWFMALEWWLHFMEGIFWATAPASLASRCDIACAGRRRSVGCSSSGAANTSSLLASSSPQLPSLRLPATVQQQQRNAQATASKTIGDAGVDASLCIGASASRRPSPQNFMRSPQEHDTSCGSPPSVSSSEVIWGSNATSVSKQTADSILQLFAAPMAGGTVHVRPALQRLGEKDTPQQLQGSLTSTTDSNDFSLSSRSIMSSVSQPSPIHKQRRCAEAASATPEWPALMPQKPASRRLATFPDVLLPSTGIVNLSPHTDAYGAIEGEFSYNNSRLLVPPMAAAIAGFYKGNATDWDLVMLVRSQSLTRAVWIEQQMFERQLIEHRKVSCLAIDTACAEMEQCLRAEEDKWLAHRRNTARYLWDQVHMEKELFARKWARERAQQDFEMYAVLSLVSLAELQRDVLGRLVEDFHHLIRESRSWAPLHSPPHRRFTKATLALGPSNSNSTLDEHSVVSRRASSEKADRLQLAAPSPAEKPPSAKKPPFEFWGYGAFLPSADSPVGFNDGLVVMSRLCRDTRLHGRRLRTHWFVNDEDCGEGQPTASAQDFHDIHYANHDTYTGFTRVQMADESVEDDHGGMEIDEAPTPRDRTDSMTDIHREGEWGAGQMLRHGLGNYACKSLGYTYVGGWYMDRPHGDGALLYNGALPWETRKEGTKKSLFLIFGRWEHGRLAHLELSFSGVPLT